MNEVIINNEFMESDWSKKTEESNHSQIYYNLKRRLNHVKHNGNISFTNVVSNPRCMSSNSNNINPSKPIKRGIKMLFPITQSENNNSSLNSYSEFKIPEDDKISIISLGLETNFTISKTYIRNHVFVSIKILDRFNHTELEFTEYIRLFDLKSFLKRTKGINYTSSEYRDLYKCLSIKFCTCTLEQLISFRHLYAQLNTKIFNHHMEELISSDSRILIATNDANKLCDYLLNSHYKNNLNDNTYDSHPNKNIMNIFNHITDPLYQSYGSTIHLSKTLNTNTNLSHTKIKQTPLIIKPKKLNTTMSFYNIPTSKQPLNQHIKFSKNSHETINLACYRRPHDQKPFINLRTLKEQILPHINMHSIREACKLMKYKMVTFHNLNLIDSPDLKESPDEYVTLRQAKKIARRLDKFYHIQCHKNSSGNISKQSPKMKPSFPPKVINNGLLINNILTKPETLAKPTHKDWQHNNLCLKARRIASLYKRPHQKCRYKHLLHPKNVEIEMEQDLTENLVELSCFDEDFDSKNLDFNNEIFSQLHVRKLPEHTDNIKCKECYVTLQKSTPLTVVFNADITTGATIQQVGWIYLHLYLTQHSPCVLCSSCSRHFSVCEFLNKHMFSHHCDPHNFSIHRDDNNNKIISTNSDQATKKWIELVKTRDFKAWKDFLNRRLSFREPCYLHHSPDHVSYGHSHENLGKYILLNDANNFDVAFVGEISTICVQSLGAKPSTKTDSLGIINPFNKYLPHEIKRFLRNNIHIIDLPYSPMCPRLGYKRKKPYFDVRSNRHINDKNERYNRLKNVITRYGLIPCMKSLPHNNYLMSSPFSWHHLSNPKVECVRNRALYHPKLPCS
ncbi:unnamed protein product [Gordionus sp. m RMFG-2023]|uniref:uncharacterized protein LOC135926118 n=1 Tax=Gordionus sp. m RMFG-2023 TaxID=3053472 RepID=UPI0030DFF210